MKLQLIIFFFLLLPISQYAQDISNYQAKHYTIDDGLPSNECYTSLQDSLGYIWIATDRGLSRFDGYGFKNYGIENGLADLSCLQMQMDVHGDIWLRTYSNRFFKYILSLDSIVAYPFNKVVSENCLNEEISNFYAGRDTLYVSIRNKGILKIDKQGQYTTFPKMEKDCYSSYLEIDGNLLSFEKAGNCNLFYHKNGMVSGESELMIGNTFYNLILKKDRKKLGNKFIGQINNETIVYSWGEHIYLIKNLALDTIISSPIISDMELLNNGRILISDNYGGGLRIYDNIKSLSSSDYEFFLSEFTTSSITKGSGEYYVITTLDHGFLILKPSEVIALSNSEFDDHNIVNIQGKDFNNIFLNVNHNAAYRHDLRINQTKAISLNSTQRLHHLFLDIDNQIQVLSASPVSFIKSSSGNNLLKVLGYSNHVFLSKRIKKLNNGKFLMIAARRINVYDQLLEDPVFSSYPTLKGLYALDAYDYKEGYLLGCRDGLYFLKEYEKVKMDNLHPFFNYRINSIEKINDNYWLGSLGGGLAIWDGDSCIEVINESKGLASNNVEKIVVDSSNALVLVCTKSGLTKIVVEDEISLTNYSVKNGLPSNQVNDVAVINDTIIVATSKGLAYIAGERRYENAKKPIIEELLVNDESINSTQTANLDYSQNSVEVKFKSLDYVQDGNILYSYRLNDDSWHETFETEIYFASLNPGKYRFEVKASDGYENWSQVSNVDFKIAQPWWRTWLFFTACVLLFLLLIFWLYVDRINKIKEENNRQNEISSLEKAALKAQMNPHFIFNCLNSIQSYIIQNDKEKAMHYLSQFAKLIRQYLRASVNETTSLDEEINMLHNYLSLEQIRFNHKFDFKFEVDDSIIQEEVFLPSMLIQPIVENAIVHGITAKNEGGMIEVFISKNQGWLDVTVKDNGVGLNFEKSPTKNKSFGLSITQKRLALINENLENYSINARSDQSGAIVNLRIKHS